MTSYVMCVGWIGDTMVFNEIVTQQSPHMRHRYTRDLNHNCCCQVEHYLIVFWFCVLVFVDELLLQLLYFILGALNGSGVLIFEIVCNLVNLQFLWVFPRYVQGYFCSNIAIIKVKIYHILYTMRYCHWFNHVFIFRYSNMNALEFVVLQQVF